jgi:thiol-disulfide isomerase/thioredoxin
MKNVFFIIFVIFSFTGCNSGQTQQSIDFTLLDLEGKIHSDSEWLGKKVVILNFWATWCPPCVREIPGFIKLQEKYGEQGIQFIGIAIDNKNAVQSFVKKMGTNYPILLGDQKAINLAISLGNKMAGLPFTVVIDRNGKIILRQIGQISEQKIEHTILPLL